MKFKIGDKVRVKYFKDMVKRQKADQDGDIRFNNDSAVFIRRMKVYCGEVYTIQDIADDGTYILDTDEWWCFTDNMLEDFDEDQKLETQQTNKRTYKKRKTE